MTNKPIELQMAEWMVVAYMKCWTWKMFNITAYQATGTRPSEYPFLPDSIYWGGKVTMRSYFEQNWPRLNKVMLDATPAQAIALAKEIVRLKWNGERPTGVLTKVEQREITKSRQELRIATTAYNLSQKLFRQGSSKYRGVAK